MPVLRESLHMIWITRQDYLGQRSMFRVKLIPRTRKTLRRQTRDEYRVPPSDMAW
jgi:hypothetical protein